MTIRVATLLQTRVHRPGPCNPLFSLPKPVLATDFSVQFGCHNYLKMPFLHVSPPTINGPKYAKMWPVRGFALHPKDVLRTKIGFHYFIFIVRVGFLGAPPNGPPKLTSTTPPPSSAPCTLTHVFTTPLGVMDHQWGGDHRFYVYPPLGGGGGYGPKNPPHCVKFLHPIFFQTTACYCVVRSRLLQGGGGVEKNSRQFFSVPPPSPGVPPQKKLAPHIGIFFCQEEFFYYVLLELAWHLHFATLYDIGT